MLLPGTLPLSLDPSLDVRDFWEGGCDADTATANTREKTLDAMQWCSACKQRHTHAHAQKHTYTPTLKHTHATTDTRHSPHPAAQS